MNFKKLKFSFIYAAKGLWLAFREQQNFQIQVFVALVVILFAIVLDLDYLRICILLVAISQVLTLEVANSALEKYIDKLTPNEDKTIGLVKDILAGAVLIAAIFSILIGIIIFYQPIKTLL